ncbi:CASTOR/POLLUX-related putative ion channel [Aliidiomarina sp. Khilg15.8]
MLHLRLIDRLKFHVERQLSKGAFYQLIVVGFLVLLVSILGGILVSSIRDPGAQLNEHIWWAFLRLTDPGYLGDDEGAWRRLVSTILTVLGYVLFMGTLVAIMTQWLVSKMRTLEQGTTPIALRQHFVILGWTSRTLPIISDLMHRGPLFSPSQQKRVKTKLAVLADDITEGPSEAVHSDRGLYKKRRQVILRSGSMLNPAHLHRVAAAKAQAVIIPSRNDMAGSLLSADAEVIKTLLSLNAQYEGGQPPLAVAELQSEEKIPLALHSYRGPLQLVASDTTISRMMVKSILNPGIADVLDNLLVDSLGSQLFLTSPDTYAGKTWGDLHGIYEAAIPIGLLRRQNERWAPVLNPSPDTLIEATDELVLLAKQYQDIVMLPPSRTAEQELEQANVIAQQPAVAKKKILLLGWNSKIPTFIRHLESYADRDFELLLLSTSDAEQRRKWVGESRLACRFEQVDYSVQSVLQSFSPEQFDSIILFASDRLQSGEESDARSVVANQLLDLLLQDAERRPQVILELTDPNNALFVSDNQHTLGSEVLQSASMISHVLAQLALYPRLRVVYDELLSARGSSLSLQPLPTAWYGNMSFRQLQSAVSSAGCILLGIKEGEDRAWLNVPPGTEIECNETTQLVILAETN